MLNLPNFSNLASNINDDFNKFALLLFDCLTGKGFEGYTDEKR